MQSNLEVIVKVLIISTFLSLLIKYGGRLLAIEANITNALLAILLPALIMGLILWFRKI